MDLDELLRKLTSIEARMFAFGDLLAHLLAMHYTQAELSGIVDHARGQAEVARLGEAGVTRLPSVEVLMSTVAEIQEAIASLGVRAIELAEQERAKRLAAGVSR